MTLPGLPAPNLSLKLASNERVSVQVSQWSAVHGIFAIAEEAPFDGMIAVSTSSVLLFYDTSILTHSPSMD